MKIFTASQIRKADAYTIEHEPISSIDLMERAATTAFDWIISKWDKNVRMSIFCGVGNNGGDGLVIARLLHQIGYCTDVYEVQFSTRYSSDYIINKKRLADMGVSIVELTAKSNFYTLGLGNVIVDAIFGSGLSREVSGWIGDLLSVLNASKSEKVTIDIASGLFAENNDANKGVVFKPNYTLTFQFPKLAFFFPKNHQFVGSVFTLPIGISESFILNEPTNFFTIKKSTARLIRKQSCKYDHKGIYGHALIMAGSYGKMGAAILAAKAALKTGAGLVSAHVPNHGNAIMQTAIPEVMTIPDTNERILTQIDTMLSFSAIGIGPGIGQDSLTVELLKKILTNNKAPLVLDADALNILAANNELLSILPNHTILTPHIGEWRKLGGKSKGDFHRLQTVLKFAVTNRVIVVLKGAHTMVVAPNGNVFINTTGNPGMATAGSGDVLTGVITALLAQKYEPLEAAILGVFIHGTAGDKALKNNSREGITASDIIRKLGKAFGKLR